MLALRGLYPIVDLEGLERRGLPVVPFAEQILLARPRLLQLRAKATPALRVLAVARELVARCRAAGTRFVMNDRVDLAVLAGADGVHVGQDDVPVAAVRSLAPGLLVGLSTHSLDELRAGLASGPSYVAIGPVFETDSKRDPGPALGLSGVREARALAASQGVPLVAIGGLREEHLGELGELGVGAAVISLLYPPAGGLESVGSRAVLLEKRFELSTRVGGR